MKFIALVLVLFVVQSTKPAPVDQTSECPPNEALRLAVREMKRTRYDINHYVFSQEDDSASYRIEFSLKDTLQDGGGAIIVVSKKVCRITQRRFFQ